MKIEEFNKDIGGLTYFMKVITKDTKMCFQLSSNSTLFSDISFSGVNTVEGASAEGVDYCGNLRLVTRDFA